MIKLIDLPYGSVIEYRKKKYFKTRGMDGDIVHNVEGRWFFIKDLNWKKFKVLL